MKDFDIITIGNVFNENIRFIDKKSGPFLGGTVSYSAVVLSRLGSRVGIVSNLGEDTPRDLLAPIIDSGVDISGLRFRKDSPTNKNILIYNEAGEKEILYLEKAKKIVFEDIPIKYFNSNLIYLCPVDFDVLPETVGDIRSKVPFVAADLGGFGGAHCSIQSRTEFYKQREKTLQEYLRYIDIAKVSIEDCHHLFGDFGLSEQEITAKLQELPLEICILTLGEKGAVILKENDKIYISSIKVDTIDTTGAGDTFMAAFLSEYIKGKEIKYCGEFANATSSLLIEKTGGVNIRRIPNKEEVLLRMNYYSVE